jgi:hypothetical protein
MTSVQRLAQALELGDPELALHPQDGEPPLSANLCEGLLDMAPEGEGSALTIAAHWDPHLHLVDRDTLPVQVQLRRGLFDRIETLAARLRPTPREQRKTLLGFVETLSGRPNADNRMEGQVLLRLVDPESESLRARTELNTADYHTAWLAHGENQPIALQGIVRRVGRFFRIDNVTGFHLLAEMSTLHTEAS